MKTKAYLISPRNITVTIDNKTQVINRSDSAADRIIELLKKNDWRSVYNLLNRSVSIPVFMDGTVQVKNGVVFNKGNVVHNLIAQRILEFMADGSPHRPLVKFLQKIEENPDERCKNSLYQFIEDYGIPLDESGCIVGYKSLQPDFTDWFSGKIKHKVGKSVRWGTHKGEREINDGDYGLDCADSGYHVGNFDYANNFGEKGRVLCLVKVHPKDVISVPNEASMGKIRVKNYYVMGIYKDDKAISNRLVYGRTIKKAVKRGNYIVTNLQRFWSKRDSKGHFVKA